MKGKFKVPLDNATGRVVVDLLPHRGQEVRERNKIDKGE
jgi:hypothetical protein